MVVHFLEDADKTRSETRPTNTPPPSQGMMGGLSLPHSRVVPRTHDWTRSTYMTAWSLSGTPWAVSMRDPMHADTWFIAFSIWGMDGRSNATTRGCAAVW
jgi:hypothetical protein